MRLVSLMLVAALSTVPAACGEGGGSASIRDAMATPEVPPVTQFPKTRGRTMAEMISGVQAGPVLAPTVGLLEPGRQRFGFGLFDRTRKQITDAAGALYIARGENARAYGPYIARWESLVVKGRYLSRTVATDPEAAKTLYVAELPFKKPGNYVVLGLFRLDNRLVGARRTVKVIPRSNVPAVGDPAPKMTTPTKQSVAGDMAKIDTRDPPDDLHDVNYADALGKRPIVLVFATPALCRSRACGPVVDITEKVRNDRPRDDVAWIHMEIYNNNRLNDGYRPQFLKYRLPTEPWLFTIDRQGRIAARIEGAFSADELEKAIDAATK